ncbi:hypothetical protein NMY22_g832 [Coprinellus aureogranulatus]|nr:hypothetical protein NMY22_g832 [Coprinellus aureogranulatus]
MNSKSAPKRLCCCAKANCPASPDIKRKAAWMGVSFAHAAHILDTLQDAPSIVPDSPHLLIAAEILTTLIPVLQDQDGVKSDLRLLLVECSKFFTVIAIHLLEREQEASLPVIHAMKTVRATVEEAQVLCAKDNSWSRKLKNLKNAITGFGSGSDDRERDEKDCKMGKLQDALKAAWDGCRVEVTSSCSPFLDVNAGGMTEQLTAMIETEVYMPRPYDCHKKIRAFSLYWESWEHPWGLSIQPIPPSGIIGDIAIHRAAREG